MKQINPYLNFDGNCGEAFRFYHSSLGGELFMQTHGESPMKDQAPPELRDLIMHARLEVEGAILMGSDAMPGTYGGGGSNYVSLTMDSVDDIDRIFGLFAEGATIQMPVQETFWTKRFGMLVDRFGTPWMFNYAHKEG